MKQSDINNKNDIPPFSLIYIGEFGGVHKFFINKGFINPTWDSGNIFLAVQKKEINTGFFALNKLKDANLNELEEIGVMSNDEDNVFLKKFFYPLDSVVELSSSSSIFLRIPKTPAGQFLFGTSLFLKNTTVNAYLNSDFTNMYANEARIATEFNLNDSLYIRSHDPLASFSGLPDGSQDSNGAIYIKIADVEITDEGVSVTKYLNSHVVFPNVHIFPDPSMHKNCFCIFGYIYNTQPDSGSEEDYQLGSNYYISPSWLTKSKSQIKQDAVSEIEGKIVGNYAERLLGLDENEVASLSIKEILFVYKTGANQTWRFSVLKSNFDENYTYESSLEREYRELYPTRFD